MVRLAVAVLALVLMFAAPGVASAAQYGGGADDPAGDQTAGQSSARDLAHVDAAYDAAAGTVTVKLTFSTAPDGSSETFAFATLGTASGATCRPGVVLGALSDAPANPTSGNAPQWAAPGSKSGPATATLSDRTLTITASSADLAGIAPDCVSAQIGPNSGPFDTGSASVAVTQPDPPPPTTTPTPTPAPTPAPTPTPVPKAAKLALSVTGVPKTIRRNRSLTLTLNLQNAGSAPAKKVKLRVAQARGLSVTPRSRTLSVLNAGATRKLKVKVRLTSTAKTLTKLIAIGESGTKLGARGTAVLRIGTAKAPKKPAGGGSTGAGAKNPLVGSDWWRTENHAERAWDNRGLYFVDDKWVYRGFPSGGLSSVKCSAATAQGEDSDDPKSFGCLPYSYDAKTGAVAVGGLAGTYVSGALTVGGQTFKPLTPAKPGATFDVSLVHRSFNGLCGVYSTCTTSLSTFVLKPDSSFVLTDQSTTTVDTGGSFTGGSGGPPGKRGLYQVQPNGTIYLAYADGHSEAHTFAIIADDAGRPDPVGGGLMLDQDNYYTESD